MQTVIYVLHVKREKGLRGRSKLVEVETLLLQLDILGFHVLM